MMHNYLKISKIKIFLKKKDKKSVFFTKIGHFAVLVRSPGPILCKHKFTYGQTFYTKKTWVLGLGRDPNPDPDPNPNPNPNPNPKTPKNQIPSLNPNPSPKTRKKPNPKPKTQRNSNEIVCIRIT
jgi:hypothetical protein